MNLRVLFIAFSLPFIYKPLISIASEEPLLQQIVLSSSLAAVEIRGLKRTEEAVVKRELALTASNETENTMAVAVQELKNLRIFSQVKPELDTQQQDVRLRLKLEEKWTTIPVMKYSSGGGTQYFVVGVYDINSFGRYLELGAQYENWNGENAGVVWFRNPRFLEQRLKFSTDIWSVKRPAFFYDNEANEVGQFVLDRKRFNLGLEKTFRNWITVGAGLDFYSDKFVGTRLDSGFNDAYAQQSLSQTTNKSAVSRWTLGLGRINYDNYLVNGYLTELIAERSIRFGDYEQEFSKFSWDNKAYWRLPLQSNIALRFLASATDSNSLQHIYSVGGFENVRGYFDGQFRGRAFWQSNLEFRIPSIRKNWFVIQHNFFLDAAQVKQSVYDLSFSGQDTFVSTGLGVRLTSPKIYRFTARLDYVAWTSQQGAGSLSIGVQQFF